MLIVPTEPKVYVSCKDLRRIGCSTLLHDCCFCRCSWWHHWILSDTLDVPEIEPQPQQLKALLMSPTSPIQQKSLIPLENVIAPYQANCLVDENADFDLMTLIAEDQNDEIPDEDITRIVSQDPGVKSLNTSPSWAFCLLGFFHRLLVSQHFFVARHRHYLFCTESCSAEVGDASDPNTIVSVSGLKF